MLADFDYICADMETSALHSHYIIDGSVSEQTPAQILASVSVCAFPEDGSEYASIIDESLDPAVRSSTLSASCIDSYLARILEADEALDPAYSDSGTRFAIASALTRSLWQSGHYGLENLLLNLRWKWDMAPVGSASAFYSSALAVSDYLEALDLRLESCRFEQDFAGNRIDVSVCLDNESDSEDVLVMGKSRSCPETLVADPQSWVVYVPFDTCDFRLGGSLLARTLGVGGGVPPQIADADYFIDCYEVLRELVEDGVVISGISVAEGGLIKALSDLTADGTGLVADVSDIMKSYEENDLLRILFAEVPGVLIQIRDSDFDYLDAELLLQDVAFFPLGHPSTTSRELRLKSSAKSGIQRILESLMQNAEGED